MSAKDDRQIYLATHKCEEKLRDLLALCSTMDENDSRFVRDISQQFELWSGYLGVFADQNISLDARLERAPDVKELILQFLRILQNDIDFVLSSSREGGNDTASTITPVARIALESLESTIDRLQRLSKSIRSISAESLELRAQNFALKRQTGCDTREIDADRLFERTITLFIRDLHPEVISSLEKQLLSSIEYQRLRLLSHRRHQRILEQNDAKLGSLPALDPVERPPESHSNVRDQPTQCTTSQHPKPETETISNTILSEALRPIKIPSSPDFHDVPRVSTTVSIDPGHYPYPKPPKLPGEGNFCKCPWCGDLLERVAFADPKFWRSHLKTDIQPYICISEQCSESQKSFTSLKSWRRHMDESHGCDWPQTIHKPRVWFCDFDDGEYSEFQTVEALRKHLSDDHPQANFSAPQIASKCRWNILSIVRKSNICPLCNEDIIGSNVLPSSKCHEATHRDLSTTKSQKRKRKVILATSDDEVESDSSCAELDGSSDDDAMDTADATKIARHIGNHLKSLVFLSMRHLDEVYGDAEGEYQSEQTGQAVKGILGEGEDYDLAQIHSIPQLKAIAKTYIGSQPQIALKAQQMLRSLSQGRILDRLWFRWIDDRKANIADRHLQTLDWALDQSGQQLKWDGLAEWLRSDSKVYWLSGKPGSGKSTLMKYLSNHLGALSLLKQWAGKSELVISQFFSYSLGTPEQKSEEGLLRTLLYQILDEDRNLIEQILPAMWKEATMTENTDHELAMPSISEMQTGLFNMYETVSADKKFWILIDGLDEFEGKHATIVAFISRLERLPNVKLIASSRPFPVFASHFEHAPKMYLQDLTNQDIVAYIEDTIVHHPRMAQAAPLEQKKATEIARILTEKASGVFLWVVLACRSILEGLEEYETVPELMRRITELPSELDDFFRQMISGVDKRNRDQFARLLRLVFESQRFFKVESIPAIGLAIVDEQGLRADYMGPNVPGVNSEQLGPRCQSLERRLRSWCSGLVEVQGKGFSGRYRGGGEGRVTPIATEDAALVDSRVMFVHKSIYDFLCTDGTWEWDVLRVDNASGKFEPHLVLASLWTQLAGLQAIGDSDFQIGCLETALVHNAQAETTKCPPRLLATSLSRVEGLFAGHETAYNTFEPLAGICLPHSSKCPKNYENLSGGLAFAAELGMVSLIRFALEEPDELRRALIKPETQHVQECSGFSTCSRGLYKLNMNCAGSYTNRSTLFPLLYYATCQPLLAQLRIGRSGSGVDRTIIGTNPAVEYLLKWGHDPNEEFFTKETLPSTTVWIEWLLVVRMDWSEWFKDSVEWIYQRAATALLLVNAGAEIGAPGTEICKLIDESLSRFIADAEQRSSKFPVEWARSDALWLKVRDRIQSLRTAASQQDAQSR